ncbi:MAG: hypothetical protein QW542_03265 [Thermoproteota archaeon]
MSATFTVTGERRYRDIILKTDTLVFERNSKLVLAPTEKNPNAPRTLTIIAKTIDIQGNAEITYDLDGRTGLDPDTPAPPTTTIAPSGSNGSSPPGEGSYPHAADGGPGRPGRSGARGIDGMDAPVLEIFADKVTSSDMRINFKGQDGGRGGRGGDGGKGGDGQKGAASKASSAWYDGEECEREPGRGGNGGAGGDAGYPGRGGKGGNGGIVKVFVSHDSLALAQAWNIVVSGGKGGDAGDPGNPGAGGRGGAQGDKHGPCPERSEYRGRDGPPGRSMSVIDPDWRRNFKGDDGRDGYYSVDELRGMPR